MHIYADDHFIPLGATIRECITAIYSVVIKQCECSIVTKISKGIASRETTRFLKLMISKTQRSWRQFCDVTTTGSFQTGLETIICRRLQGPSQLSTPLYSQLILRIYAAMNRLGGGAKTEFAPGAGIPRCATGRERTQNFNPRRTLVSLLSSWSIPKAHGHFGCHCSFIKCLFSTQESHCF